MGASRSRVRARPQAAWIVVVAAAVLAVGVTVSWHPWASASAPAADASGAAIAEGPAPLPLALPVDARVLIFGDSWTYGSAATVRTDGYAYVVGRTLGWDLTVDGVRGSGYLKPGIDGPTFGERIAALDPDLDPDLVIIQGSINDRAQGASGYREAVDAAWSALSALYPGAAVVVLGPAPHVLPVEAATARIDRDLAALAGARGWWYISPVAEGWITEANYLDVIDTGAGNNHPSTAGHAYLASRLAEAIVERSATTDAAAVSDPGAAG